MKKASTPSKTPTRRDGRRGVARRRQRDIANLLDDREVLSAVCRFFCKGMKVKEIIAAVHREYGVVLKREDPYELVRGAARRGWLNFNPPPHLALADKLRRSHAELQGINVVHTTVVRDVAQHAADMLLGLLQRYRRQHGREEVHIGFAGGHSMRALARAFAELLCRPTEDLPESIVFHSMAAGFDPEDPTTDPNSFFSYFLNEPVLQVRSRFMGLSAPSMVKEGDIPRLKDLPDIKTAFAATRDIDIIVTSGTEWSDPHSALLKRMQRSKTSLNTLKKEDCVGDILWRPLADSGPIEKETTIRALTLIELSELTGFIRRGKHVLLMLAPCGGCNEPKGRLLGSLLQQSKPLITHLVVDSRSAGQMMRQAAEGKRG